MSGFKIAVGVGYVLWFVVLFAFVTAFPAGEWKEQ